MAPLESILVSVEEIEFANDVRISSSHRKNHYEIVPVSSIFGDVKKTIYKNRQEWISSTSGDYI